MFHFQQKCPEEMVVSWKKMKWEGCLRCTSPHRGCQRKRKLKLLCSLLPYWKTGLGVLFESICDFITSADMLLWNLEYSLLQFSSCGSLRHNGIGWTSANAGDVLRRRPCRELPCFLWSYLFWGSFPLGFVLLLGQAACMQRANDAKACLERNCRPA